MIGVPGILDTECAQLNKLWSRPPHVSESTPFKGKKSIREVTRRTKTTVVKGRMGEKCTERRGEAGKGRG